MSGKFYKIKYNSMEQLHSLINSTMNDWYKDLEEWAFSYAKILEMESFKGKSAESVKAYLQEVHGVLLYSIQQTFVSFQSRYLLYKTGYYNIERNVYASLPEEIFNGLAVKLQTEAGTLNQIYDSIKGSLDSIADIYWLPVPSKSVLEGTIDGMRKEVQDFDEKINHYEREQKIIVNGDMKTLLDALQSTVQDYLTGGSSIASYQSGELAGNTNLLNLYQAVMKSGDFIAENQEKIESASQEQLRVYEQMEADYEAACEARKDKGIAEGIIGVTAVAVGVVAIIGTAGMATPIVVTAGVAGSSAIVYGASNLSEGVQDGYYGSHGNLSIAAVNPVRDFIFAGNQGLYDAWGNLSMTVAGLCIPIGQAVNGVAGAGRDILAKTAIKTIAKETVKDKIYDGISTGITNFATEKFNLSQSGAVLLNAGLSFGLERGVEFSGKKLGIISEHSFAQDMSFDDAARYNKFMDESMHGIHNNHPGLNNMDIKAWNLADTKLKEHLSIEKVDVNEILDLRMREMEMENYFLNRPKKGSDIGNRTCLSGAEHFEALKEMFGEENVEWISRDTLSGSDRIRIQNWGDNAPIEDMYIKYKNVYQNDLYYNQSTGEVRWPNNDGFDEAPRNIILQPGDRVDRYGSDYGTFLSPVGVPYEQRSLAPGTELKPYSVFEVMKPIEVKSGKIAAWFNQPGGGIQYIVPDIIDELIDKGFLRRINE